MNDTIFWEQTGGNMKMIGTVPGESAEQIRQAIVEAGQPVHGNSEPVYVMEVDQTEYAKHLPPHGKAKPLEVNQTFSSALAASLHLGYNHNEVTQGLSRDNRERQRAAKEKYGHDHTTRIRPETTLRGARLQYERDCNA